jgi:hypothetical protein
MQLKFGLKLHCPSQKLNICDFNFIADFKSFSTTYSKKPKKMVVIYLQGIKRGLHLQPLTTAKFIVTDGEGRQGAGVDFFLRWKKET